MVSGRPDHVHGPLHPSSHPLIRAWVDLHVAPEFKDGVAWLKAELDAIGPKLPPERQRRLAQLFLRTLELEIAFHWAPYGETSEIRLTASGE